MDHYQVLVPDVLATAKFYMDLGFRISDYLYVEAAGAWSARSCTARTIRGTSCS